MMLRILKHATKGNPELYMDILLFLKSQLGLIQPCEKGIFIYMSNKYT